MPDIENTDLGWLIQFLGRVNTLGKRGMRAALARPAALPPWYAGASAFPDRAVRAGRQHLCV